MGVSGIEGFADALFALALDPAHFAADMRIHDLRNLFRLCGAGMNDGQSPA